VTQRARFESEKVGFLGYVIRRLLVVGGCIAVFRYLGVRFFEIHRFFVPTGVDKGTNDAMTVPNRRVNIVETCEERGTSVTPRT